jgi:hypothetical protein
MSIEVSEKPRESNYEPVPAGNHVARIYSIVHIGTTLEDTPWGTKEQNKVRITFELPNETKEFKEGEGEKPMSISRTFNISWHEKASLRKFVRGLRGKDEPAFDLETLLGEACMLNVSHNEANDRTYANIDSAAPLPKGMEAPAAVNEAWVLNYTDKWDDERFSKLPDFLKEQMEKSDEFKARRQKDSGEIAAEDIPF